MIVSTGPVIANQFSGVKGGSSLGAFASTSHSSQGIAKHKTQIKTQNTKLKSVKRGCTGGGAIFKFDDVGPRPSGLKGCAIRRSRANAVQEYARLQDTVSETCGAHRPANGPQGPQNAGE